MINVCYGIIWNKSKAKYKSYKGDRKGTAKNLLLHKGMDEEHHKTYYAKDFKTGKYNEKWSTDVSQFHIATGKRYLSPIMYLHIREIISYTISKSPNFKQIKDMLSKAFCKYPELNGPIKGGNIK